MKRGKGGTEKVSFFLPPPPHPVGLLNDQSFILLIFEGLVLLSPSDIIWELCELRNRISQGIDWYKVPVVGKHGKLNETIEVGALWSIRYTEETVLKPQYSPILLY